uniref:Uncharacterized protein n=1 Tax=Trichogramma kaykai TaxID=54128 RepID=A0ABD2X660_9HYME
MPHCRQDVAYAFSYTIYVLPIERGEADATTVCHIQRARRADRRGGDADERGVVEAPEFVSSLRGASVCCSSIF